MILSDKTILKMLENKSLTITPVEKEQIQPASVDVRLGNTFSIVEDMSRGILSLDNEIVYKTITADTCLLYTSSRLRVLSGTDSVLHTRDSSSSVFPIKM